MWKSLMFAAALSLGTFTSTPDIAKTEKLVELVRVETPVSKVPAVIVLPPIIIEEQARPIKPKKQTKTKKQNAGWTVTSPKCRATTSLKCPSGK